MRRRVHISLLRDPLQLRRDRFDYVTVGVYSMGGYILQLPILKARFYLLVMIVFCLRYAIQKRIARFEELIMSGYVVSMLNR